MSENVCERVCLMENVIMVGVRTEPPTRNTNTIIHSLVSLASILDPKHIMLQTQEHISYTINFNSNMCFAPSLLTFRRTQWRTSAQVHQRERNTAVYNVSIRWWPMRQNPQQTKHTSTIHANNVADSVPSTRRELVQE